MANDGSAICLNTGSAAISFQMKKTPLFEEHLALNARIVPFAGWEMPVEYAGLRKEHEAVRTSCGLFDVSHMGEIRVRGPKAVESLQWITTNDVGALQKGQAHYTLFPNENGGIVDDLIIYCLEPNADYLLCVNASNTDKDWEFVQANNKGADIKNESSEWAQVALQGPKAFDVLKDAIDLAADQYKPFQVIELQWQGAQMIVAFTGYTGEAGVEIFVPAGRAKDLWRALMEVGQRHRLQPCGLGARDTLRTEMKYSLYGNEIDDTTNPYMAGLGWVVKPAAKDFIGKDLILKQKENGFAQKLIGFKMVGKGIARHGYDVLDVDKKKIGTVTSGTVSPSLNENIGIAYVAKSSAELGSRFWVDIRGRAVEAQVVKTPFVTK